MSSFLGGKLFSRNCIKTIYSMKSTYMGISWLGLKYHKGIFISFLCIYSIVLQNLKIPQTFRKTTLLKFGKILANHSLLTFCSIFFLVKQLFYVGFLFKATLSFLFLFIQHYTSLAPPENLWTQLDSRSDQPSVA